jgi:hypothetical protein
LFLGICAYCCGQAYLDVRRKKYVMAAIGALSALALGCILLAMAPAVFDPGIR